MEQLRFQHKKFQESGHFQETHIGFHKTFPRWYLALSSSDGLKETTRLRLGLNHLQDILNSICSCGTVQTTIHYLLHCSNFSNDRLALFNKLQSIDENVLTKDDSHILNVLFFGNH